ncbi:MAG TPA: biotin--[acetyl-CoA-carboxylase] ligase [Planctomycetota bacterium]|nr:biotin--[acetyl-CoA-carboxylase] ligase [Planctomycetota bacterium]
MKVSPAEQHERLGSTQERARELAQKGAPEGTLVVAREQTGGKGRLGRAWASPTGGLYLSLVLRPDEGMLKRASISLVAALAASEALDATARVSTSLKWPNDIVLHGKKLGGVLADLVREGKDSYLILGVGLNVNTARDAFPAEVRTLATSLAIEKSATFSTDEVLEHFVSHFEGHYESVRKGSGALLLSRAADRMTTLGSRVRVKVAGRTIEGKASGLNATGALVVELDDKKREILYAGDVEELRSL